MNEVGATTRLGSGPCCILFFSPPPPPFNFSFVQPIPLPPTTLISHITIYFVFKSLKMTGRKSSSPPGSSPPAAGGVEFPDHVIEANEAEAEQSEDGYETTSNASTSLAPSVRDYNFENKRRYHKYQEGRYLLPNDDLEQEREDMKHALILHLCDGKLHNAPLKNPQKILDIGTGTGIWAMDSTIPLTKYDQSGFR